MLNFDIKRKINTLRDILVGKVPDPKAQVEQITIALIYKFMDDMDLESVEFGGTREFFKEDYEKYAWSKIMDTENSGSQRANLYADGIEKMTTNPHLPQLFRDIFKGAYIPYRDPETLNMFLKEVSDFNYDHSEELGNAFEYLLSIMGSQGDAGQFRTPRHIIDMMVEIVDPKKTDTVLDPACGTAGFLISSYKHIREKNKDKDDNSTLSADDRKRMTENFAGYDISPDMVRLSRVNMYLHKFAKPKIYEYDTLTSLDRWDESYDVILANPPFMTPKGGIIPHNRYRVKAKRSEVLFVDYIAEHLNPTGKAAIIVPEGIVFQSASAYKSLRKHLVEDDLLFAVISLPAGVFNPYSGVKTSILLFDRTIAKQKDEIIFIKIENDGFGLGAQRREVNGSELAETIKIIKDYKEGKDIVSSDLVTIAKKEDIAKHDYNLVGDRYRILKVENSSYPLVKIEDLINSVKYPEKVLKSDFMKEGKYPIIDQSDNFIAGYSNNPDFIFNITKPVICFGDHTRSIKYVDFDFVLGADGVKILEPLNSINPKFLYYCLSNIEIPSLGYSRHYKVLKDIKIPIPPMHLQLEIVEEIEVYQKIINGAKQILQCYKPTIKNKPNWKYEKVGDVVEFISGVTLSVVEAQDPNGIPLITIADVAENGHLKLDKIRTITTTKKVNFLKKGDLLFNWRNGSKHLVGKTALFNLDEEHIFASFLLGIRPDNSKIDSKFLWVLLNQYRIEGKYMQFMRQNVNGLFNREELKEVLIPIPSIDEQHNIVKHIDEEMQIMDYNNRLIELFENKIKSIISSLWGE